MRCGAEDDLVKTQAACYYMYTHTHTSALCSRESFFARFHSKVMRAVRGPRCELGSRRRRGGDLDMQALHLGNGKSRRETRLAQERIEFLLVCR